MYFKPAKKVHDVIIQTVLLNSYFSFGFVERVGRVSLSSELSELEFSLNGRNVENCFLLFF